jgi:hypothetical protein
VTNEGEVYFALFGHDFDPDEVTRLIGIEPTSTHRRGSPTPKHTSWKFSSGKIENDIVDVYEMSSSLVSRLLPYVEKIVDVKRRFQLEAVLEVVLWITTDESKSTPAIGFEPQVIAFLYTVGASIDIDTYRNMP